MAHSVQTISVTDLRLATREILEKAHFRGCHYVVERAGQPMVAILAYDEYQRLQQAAATPAAQTAPANRARDN